MKEHKELKTGTTTVGVVCKDGVVLAADKRVTAGYVANKKFKKIAKITDNIAMTMTGVVSEAQLLIRLIEAEIKLKDVHTNRVSTVPETANLLASLIYSNVRQIAMFPSIAAFLMGGMDENGFYLFDLGADGSIQEIDNYSSDGSGCLFALGVLETLYKKNMSVEDGVKLAAKAVNAAIQRDLYTGNGIDVVSITKDGVKTVMEKELTAVLQID